MVDRHSPRTGESVGAIPTVLTICTTAVTDAEAAEALGREPSIRGCESLQSPHHDRADGEQRGCNPRVGVRLPSRVQLLAAAKAAGRIA